MAVKEIMDAFKNKTIDQWKLSDLVKDIKLIGGLLEVVYRLPKRDLEKVIEDVTRQVVQSLSDVQNLKIRFVEESVPQQTSGQTIFSRRKVDGIKNILIVGSGKGGVGKSTVSANLALALSKLGYKVGLLDADIYGPSIPTILGIKGERVSVDESNKIIPLERYNIKTLSIGFLLPSEDTPIIWRGPMLMKALTQFLFDVRWGDLDFLVLDLPPGTGDVQLTLAQNVEIEGAIIVTTPQDVALADVKKAASMFKEVQIPIVGVIENMSYFVCPETNKKYYIFGKGKTVEFANTYGTKVLGAIPIDPEVAETSDKGIPVVESHPDSEVSKAFLSIAKLVTNEILRR